MQLAQRRYSRKTLPLESCLHLDPGVVQQRGGDDDPHAVEEDEVNPGVQDVVSAQTRAAHQPLRTKRHPTCSANAQSTQTFSICDKETLCPRKANMSV